MHITRFEFTIEETQSPCADSRYVACLGDYDLDAPLGYGPTPSDAVLDWFEMHGQTIDRLDREDRDTSARLARVAALFAKVRDRAHDERLG